MVQISSMIYRTLNLSNILNKNLSAFLFGARGVGKTRLINHWIESSTTEKLVYLDLLKPEQFSRYLKTPQLLFSEVESLLRNTVLKIEPQPIRVVVDEVQKIPSLLDVVHSLYETYPSKLQFLLSGSSARKLKRGGANLLAGRLLSLNLFPFDNSEFPHELNKKLLLGSLPGVILDNPQPERTLRAYVHTYLKEEVMEESLVRRIEVFTRFLELCAQFHGKQFNASSLAKLTGISSQSILSYFSILEDTLLGFKLNGWNESLKKQLRLSPKFYFIDNGIASALRGELNLEISPRTSRYGELFEAFVVQEIYKLNDYFQKDFKLSYWQTNHGKEVDIIISRGFGRPIAAIEIKSSTQPDELMLKGLFGFEIEYPNVPLFCFSQTPRAYNVKNIQVLPYTKGLQLLKTL
jgi:uncharacterized protein